jgi:hypothetical protein
MFGDQRLPERFWTKVQVGPGGCWLWTARLTEKGYGDFYLGPGHTRRAHRVAYLTLVGPVEGPLDHLCRVRRCVNPAHVEPVSSPENTRRGALDRRLAARRLPRVRRV